MTTLKEIPEYSKNTNRIYLPLLIAVLLLMPSGVPVAQAATQAPLTIQEQGSFAVGGTVITNPGTFSYLKPTAPDGQTFHGDHAYVFYQKPVNARKLPLVFLHGGGPGWYAAIKNPKVKAIVSFEPGLLLFPESEVPPPIPGSSPFDPLKAGAVSKAEFERLTKLPIVLYFGDNIPETPSENPGQDNWRTRLQMAKLWTETVNKHGGNVTLVHLPKVGITGNTHFPFADLNNVQVADHLSAWLKEKKLD